MKTGIGRLRERLVIERHDPAALTVASVTRASSTATVTTAEPHGYATGDVVLHAGAVESPYNGQARITVTGDRTYTCAVSGSPTTPATGTITSTYISDGMRGRRIGWRVLDAVPAEMLPLRGGQMLQANAIQSQAAFRFRIRARGDVTADMRCRWTPSGPCGGAAKLLGITSILPIDDGRQWMALELVQIP